MGRDITGVSLSDQIFNIQQKLIKDIALTNDDYIAFPYGVREGEKTKVSEDGMY